MDDNKEKSGFSRRDFIATATGAFAGAAAKDIARKINPPESENPLKATITVETQMSYEPYSVSTSLVPESEDQKPMEGEIQEQSEKFLIGANQIGAILTERYLDGSLSVEQISAVGDALMILKGLSPGEIPQEPSDDINASIDYLASAVDASGEIKTT